MVNHRVSTMQGENLVHPGEHGDTDHSVGVYVLWQKPGESEARLLVHRRSEQLRMGRGRVSACPGGRVSASGTFRNSAVRELEEETGLTVNPGALAKVLAHDHYGSCLRRGCPHYQRVVYRHLIHSRAPPQVPGPATAHAWEIDQNWGDRATVGISAGWGTGYRWATSAELQIMHQDPNQPSLWFPGGCGDIEIHRVLDCSPLEGDGKGTNNRGNTRGQAKPQVLHRHVPT